MRAVLLLAALLAVPLAPPAAAHEIVRCDPAYWFPTFAVWNVPAGGTSSFYLPPRTFASLVAHLPLDVTMFVRATCEADPSCHQDGHVGPLACGSTNAGVIELHNPGSVNAPATLAVGRCFHETYCELI